MGMRAVQKADELSEQLTTLGKYNETPWRNAYIATKRINYHDKWEACGSNGRRVVRATHRVGQVQRNFVLERLYCY
jgi:hypothetical protein